MPKYRPREGRDIHSAARDPAHVHQQGTHHLRSQCGRRVPAIEKPVDGDGLNLVTNAELDAGEEVAVESVYPTGAQEAYKMEGAPGLP